MRIIPHFRYRNSQRPRLRARDCVCKSDMELLFACSRSLPFRTEIVGWSWLRSMSLSRGWSIEERRPDQVVVGCRDRKRRLGDGFGEVGGDTALYGARTTWWWDTEIVGWLWRGGKGKRWRSVGESRWRAGSEGFVAGVSVLVLLFLLLLVLVSVEVLDLTSDAC